jgi:hypothetical protein
LLFGFPALAQLRQTGLARQAFHRPYFQQEVNVLVEGRWMTAQLTAARSWIYVNNPARWAFIWFRSLAHAYRAIPFAYKQQLRNGERVSVCFRTGALSTFTPQGNGCRVKLESDPLTPTWLTRLPSGSRLG